MAVIIRNAMRDKIDLLKKETETTIRTLYALQEFNFLLDDQSSVDKINNNPEFWKLFEASLTTKLFIGIRRLFESKSGTFNFNNFIKSCKDNIKLFGINELEERKLEGTINRPKGLDDYLKNSYAVTDNDFNELAKLVREYSKKMKGKYIKAASEIYAHAIHTDNESAKVILRELNFEEMEDALNALWHVYNQVWEMYENGSKPSFVVIGYPYADEIKNCICDQL